jgi:hypothetical protein
VAGRENVYLGWGPILWPIAVALRPTAYAIRGVRRGGVRDGRQRSAFASIMPAFGCSGARIVTYVGVIRSRSRRARLALLPSLDAARARIRRAGDRRDHADGHGAGSGCVQGRASVEARHVRDAFAWGPAPRWSAGSTRPS